MVLIKKAIAAIDRVLLGGTLVQRYASRIAAKKLRKQVATISPVLTHSQVTHYRPFADDRLAELCDRHGSDKGSARADGHVYRWPPHTYAAYYTQLFGHCRTSVTKVFELGLGSPDSTIANNMGPSGRPGASLRVWRDWFPNACIYGADIDARVLFQDERISTFHVDQTDPAAISRMWAEVGVEGFDLIIDDGLHEFRAGTCFYEHSAHRLRPGGVYVIEDVADDDWAEYVRYFEAKRVGCELVRAVVPRSIRQPCANTLLVVRY